MSTAFSFPLLLSALPRVRDVVQQEGVLPGLSLNLGGRPCRPKVAEGEGEGMSQGTKQAANITLTLTCTQQTPSHLQGSDTGVLLV